MNKVLFTILCCTVFFIGCQQKGDQQQESVAQEQQAGAEPTTQDNNQQVGQAPQSEIPIEELPIEIQEKIKKEIELENKRDPKIYPTEKETLDAQMMRANKIKNQVLAEEAAKNK